MLVSLFLAAEVVLEHQGDSLKYSIKMLMSLILCLPPQVHINSRVLLQDSLRIVIEECLLFLSFLLEYMCVLLVYMNSKT